MTPADYAKALERAADLAESESMDTDHDETRIDVKAIRALAKALWDIAPFCEDGRAWLISSGWDEAPLP